MSLLIGTRDGVFRAETVPFEDAKCVLDCGRTNELQTFDGFDGVFATTAEGLFRSLDAGSTWENLDVPTTDTWGVFGNAGGRLYAGTHPAHLYRSTDSGSSWTELESLRDQTTVDLWRSAYGPEAQVRTIITHPESPRRLFAGVEVGGLYRSDNGGEAWSKCEIRDQTGVVQDDIHRVLALSADEYVVACGRLSIHDPNHAAAEGGLYFTADAGGTWSRLDRDLDPSYYRSAIHHRDTLYACGATTVPPEWSGFLNADATMFASRDLGETFEAQPYPGAPDEIVLGFAPKNDRVLAGTAVGKRGRVIYRDPSEDWQTGGFVSPDVLSVCVI